MKHPIVQRYIDERAAMKREIAAVAEFLDAAAAALPCECPLPEGYACACTGACHPPEYLVYCEAAGRLRAIIERPE